MKVVFHSLRHSSITYKLKLNGQRFEEAFYSGHSAPAARQDGQPAGSQAQDAGGDGEINQELLVKLLQKPELAAMLKTLAQAI